MNNSKCEIIRDLIPLYDEKLCSAESAALIEEHIKTCTACKVLLEKLPKTELPKADTDALKPFVKVKRRLRTRSIGLIILGAVLLAVLIPIGYLTVNQIFHINGGTDFEDLIYKHEVRQFAEMIAEGRMEEYVQRYENVYLCDAPDGTSITYRSFYLEKLKTAYENVKKYDPRVGEIHSSYHNFPNHNNDIIRNQYFKLEFTRSDGTVWEIIIPTSNYDNGACKFGIPDWNDSRFMIMLPTFDSEKSYYEHYSVISDDDIPTDLREICAFVNTLYLADGGDLDIKMIEGFMYKATADAWREDDAETAGHLLAMRFALSDYNAVYEGFSDFIGSNCLLDAAVGSERFDEARNMFYYPVMLTSSDGECKAGVSVKLYYDEYGFHSPRAEDITGITNGSDLEIKFAGIFG